MLPKDICRHRILWNHICNFCTMYCEHSRSLKRFLYEAIQLWSRSSHHSQPTNCDTCTKNQITLHRMQFRVVNFVVMQKTPMVSPFFESDLLWSAKLIRSVIAILWQEYHYTGSLFHKNRSIPTSELVRTTYVSILEVYCTLFEEKNGFSRLQKFQVISSHLHFIFPVISSLLWAG